MTDELLLSCCLSAWKGETRHCRWCNAALTGRRIRWCSEICSQSAVENHLWSAASYAALRRDGRACARCGRAPGLVDDLGQPRRLVLEVHHTTPIKGKHRQTGCHHHLDGLETLCRVIRGVGEKGCHGLEHGGKPAQGVQLPLDEVAA